MVEAAARRSCAGCPPPQGGSRSFARAALGLWLGAAAGLVLAQDPRFEFQVLPAAPQAGEPFQIRIDLRPPACVRLPPAIDVVTVAPGVRRYQIEVPDFCTSPLPETSRSYAVPPLAAGRYRFQFALCSNPPPPTQACLVVEERSVDVVAAARPREVPGPAPLLQLALALGLLVSGGRGLARIAAVRRVRA